jgi:hypothetical protein
MGDQLHDDDDYRNATAHPSDPFRWIREYATYETVVWAIELSEVGRRRHLLELVSRGPISALDRHSLARFAALVIVMQDRRAMGLV